MSADELTRRLRATGRLCWTFRQTDEFTKLPIPHQRARLKVHFDKWLDAYYGVAGTEPFVNDRAPERF